VLIPFFDTVYSYTVYSLFGGA